MKNSKTDAADAQELERKLDAYRSSMGYRRVLVMLKHEGWAALSHRRGQGVTGWLSLGGRWLRHQATRSQLPAYPSARDLLLESVEPLDGQKRASATAIRNCQPRACPLLQK